MTDDKQIKSWRDIFSAQSDVAGWMVLGFAGVAFFLKPDAAWPCVALVLLGLMAIIGGDFARGTTLGPGGLSREA